MIEIKSKTHTLRLFADCLQWTDLFKLVMYSGYRGDKARIPWYYKVVKGNSCETDLTQPMEVLLDAMKSNTRNEIRRAIKEGCTFSLVESLDEFVPFYNSFCSSKGLADFTSKSRMLKYPKLLLTKALHNGQVLAMHANVLDEGSKVAFLLYSCSQRLDANVDKKLIGWGNRFLHYKDMEFMKDQGYTIYDWSGVCMDPENPKYSIGQFKLAFGGKPIESYVLTTPLFAVLEGFRNFLVKFRK